MRSRTLIDGWKYRHLTKEDHAASTEQWQEITIPHDAMLSEPRSEGALGGANTGWYEGRDYEYVTEIFGSADPSEASTILECEGIYRNAEVWLNGEHLHTRPYGYTNFYTDLSQALRRGETNELRIVARNSEQPNSRWYSGAGIYRPVNIWTGYDEHICLNGVRIRTISLKPVRIEVQVQATAAGSAQILIDGASLATLTVSNEPAIVTIDLPESTTLWTLEDPALHTCTVKYASVANPSHTDSVTENFGVRTIQWGDAGLLLNDERVILKGACIHHDNGVLGACAYADAEERKIRILQENGYNAVRSAHNPCSKALLDACDRLGMLVMDEYIDHWYIHKTQYDYVDYFNQWWRQDLTDMVEKDYNHPSVILYSTGNEVSETAQKKGIELTKQMTDFLHSLDSSRPVTCGINIFFNFLSSIGMGVYSDEKAKKEVKKEGKTKAVGSQFFNDSAGLLGADFMKHGAQLPFCDWKTRDAFAAMDIAGYNYGIYRYKHDLKEYPHRLILGSETFCSDAYRFLEEAKANPRIIGDFVWAGMDYLGEVGIGAWEYADYAPKFEGLGWSTAGSGRINLIGTPLGEAFYTRVALEKEAGPYIAVCPVNNTGKRHSPSSWKMSNAIPSWSWNGCDGNKANVEVYARAAEVELRINGKAVGHKKLVNDCIAKFSCTYEPGIIEAISYDASGNVINSTSMTTASDTTQLRVIPEQNSVESGHLAYVRLRYTDENGVVKPLERSKITVSVTGGKLIGLGSAAPYYPESYSGITADTYYGEALAVIKADNPSLASELTPAGVVVTASDAKGRISSANITYDVPGVA